MDHEILNDLSECLMQAFDESNANEWLLNNDDEDADWYLMAEKLEKHLSLHGYKLTKTNQE